MLKVAMVGYGGIAKAAHIPAYISLEKKGKAKLVAAYDIEESSFTQSQAINIGSATEIKQDINFYTNLVEMLEKEKLDLIDVCIPTYLHKGIVEDLLNLGYNVISEKPMSRTYQDCKTLVSIADKSKGKLMIAQCLRFFPEYIFLKELIDSGKYGRPVSASFRRLSDPPVWGWQNWYLDKSKSGGAILDMHIHDIDMARYLFGEPQAVSCVTKDFYSGSDIVFSNLYYPDIIVTVTGDWSLKGIGFKSDYIVALERASVICENGVVTVCPRDEEKYTPELLSVGGYESEIEFFVNIITKNSKNTKNPPRSAAMSVKLIETLQRSAENCGKRMKFYSTF